MLENRGALPSEDGDFFRGYQAMHEEDLLKVKKKRKVKVVKERWAEKGKWLRQAVKESVRIVCPAKFSRSSVPF